MRENPDPAGGAYSVPPDPIAGGAAPPREPHPRSQPFGPPTLALPRSLPPQIRLPKSAYAVN